MMKFVKLRYSIFDIRYSAVQLFITRLNGRAGSAVHFIQHQQLQKQQNLDKRNFRQSII
jgi:hypothetical protein